MATSAVAAVKIHKEKLYVHPENPLSKDEKHKRVEALVNFLWSIARHHSGPEQKPSYNLKEDQLLLTRVVKFNFKYLNERWFFAIHIDNIATLIFDNGSHVGSTRELKPRQLTIRSSLTTIDPKTFYLTDEGSRQIHGWLFSGPDHSTMGIPLKGHRIEVVEEGDPDETRPDGLWVYWKHIRQGTQEPEGLWQTKRASLTLTFGEIYSQEIYPPVLDYLDVLITEPHTHILEICGGEGLFAKQALERAHGKISRYTLLERNFIAAPTAKESLAPFITSQIAQVAQLDITHTDKVEKELEGNHYHILIGLGALTDGVLTKHDALKVFPYYASKLVLGGYVILTGRGDSWITSEILIQNGFEIKNMHCPQTGYQLYVAKKVSEAESVQPQA